MADLAAKLQAGSILDAAEAAALQEALAILKAAWGMIEGQSFNLPVSIAHVHLGAIPVSCSVAQPVIDGIEHFLQAKIDDVQARIQSGLTPALAKPTAAPETPAPKPSAPPAEPPAAPPEPPTPPAEPPEEPPAPGA